MPKELRLEAALQGKTIGVPFSGAEDPRRDSGWAPGVSGNPGGMTREHRAKLAEVQNLARSFAPAAIKRLAQLMLNADSDAVSAAAANCILDRAWGKPKPVDENSQIRQQMEQIFAIMRSKLTETEYGSLLDAMEEVAQK